MDVKLELVMVPCRNVDSGRRSYAMLLSFEDPDGNLWLVQKVTRPEPRS